MLGDSEAMQSCIHYHKNYKQYQQLRDGGSRFSRMIIRINLNWVCGGRFIDENEPGITAFATLLIAIFTFTLWRATTRLWKASKEQGIDTRRAAKAARASADALPILERAYVFMEVISSSLPHDVEELAAANHQTGKTLKTLQRTLGVYFRLVNYGKTPAVIKEITRIIKLFPDLTGELNYTDHERIAGELVIPSGKSFPRESSATIQATLRISATDAGNIKTGTTFLFFYGHIVYDDIFGNERITNFCWRYEGKTREFRPYGPPEYNKRT